MTVKSMMMAAALMYAVEVGDGKCYASLPDYDSWKLVRTAIIDTNENKRPDVGELVHRYFYDEATGSTAVEQRVIVRSNGGNRYQANLVQVYVQHKDKKWELYRVKP
ncbi:MAG: hypothetical protein KJ601_00105 [Nanoarchaeota archaeon]|nr:hypothetical protein [Nanoarchaeota archaeon]